MARASKITRTIITTEATLLCVDTASHETLTKNAILAHTYKDDKALLKEATKLLATDTLKVVSVIGKKEVETLYGMDENTFIAYAEVLPPRTKTNPEN